MAKQHFSFVSQVNNVSQVPSNPSYAKEEEEEPSQMSSSLSQMQPQPVPHSQFLNATQTHTGSNGSANSNMTFVKRSSLLSQQLQQEPASLRLRSSVTGADEGAVVTISVKDTLQMNNFVNIDGIDVSPI